MPFQAASFHALFSPRLPSIIRTSPFGFSFQRTFQYASVAQILPNRSIRSACGLTAMFGLNTRSTLLPVASYSTIWIGALRLKTSRCPSGVNATAATSPNFCPRGGAGRAPNLNGSIGTPGGGSVGAVGAGILLGSGPKSPGLGLGFCPLMTVDAHTDKSRYIASFFMAGKGYHGL